MAGLLPRIPHTKTKFRILTHGRSDDNIVIYSFCAITSNIKTEPTVLSNNQTAAPH
jgi:hypothetical protein